MAFSSRALRLKSGNNFNSLIIHLRHYTEFWNSFRRPNRVSDGNYVISFPQSPPCYLVTKSFRGFPSGCKMASTSSGIPGSRLPPVVVVLGSTASGKSKLAIDLAKHVGGEVISADSMQVYEGLDILTNKATEEEMQGIPHHMIGVVDRTQKFDVVKFRDLALPIVEEILSKGKVPFIVGGTNYYIESLLWKVLMNETACEAVGVGENAPVKKSKLCEQNASTEVKTVPPLEFMQERKGNFTETEVVEKWSETELHQALQQVDPKRALKVHPNDRRKVVRSLQVFFRTGRPHSELIEEQCSMASDEDSNDESGKATSSLTGKLGGPLRFDNAFCLWIQADRNILNKRIEDRVEQMVERGIQEEIDSYVDFVKKEGGKWDFELGQMQSIGVKEFESYIQLPSDERHTEKGEKHFKEGLERLKIVTKQYAKRQVQWMTQRFLKSTRRQVPPVYGLDGNQTDEVSWAKNVTNPAKEILDAYLQGNTDLPLLNEKRVQMPAEDEEADFISRKCEACDKILLGSSQWKEHIRSSKHWKIVKKKKKEVERLSTILTNRTLVLQQQQDAI